MRSVHCFVAALTLIAVGTCGTASAAAPAKDARAAVQGRQKIRAELEAAMAKGHLTHADEYRLLLHAKQVLTPEDFDGFQRTIDRIVMQQMTARPAAAAAHGHAAAARQDRDDDGPAIVATSRMEELADNGNVSVSGGPPPRMSADAADGPYIEEVPAGIGRPSMRFQDALEGCGCDDEECRPARRWIGLDLFSGIEAFKGPLDVGDANGNFGVRLGVNAAVPVFQRLGFALQAGMAADLSNLKGSPYPFPNATIRDQIFTTVGFFQRINRCDGGAFTWGFAYDWLFDDYYSNFHFGQWRVKAEYEVDECDAFGLQASIPEHGSTEETLINIDGSPLVLSFKPLAQGSFYWTHTFSNAASLTGRFGVAERPSNFVFGGDGCVPLTRNLGLTGGFTYIMPNAGAGDLAQTQEMWNVSVGIEIVPGGFRRCGGSLLRPFIPVADNGSLAVREVGQ